MQAKNGDYVYVHYQGTLSDGTVFDSSYESDEPLEFELGSGILLPDFESAVVGMEIGEKKEFTILAENAYGNYDDTLLFDIDRAQLDDDGELEPGDELRMVSETDENEVIDLTIVEISDTTITVDANHELAGEDLNFAIELIKIKE